MPAGRLSRLLPLAAMSSPEAAKALRAMPERFPFSTALTFGGGGLRWKGDWPLDAIAKFVQAVREAG